MALGGVVHCAGIAGPGVLAEAGHRHAAHRPGPARAVIAGRPPLSSSVRLKTSPSDGFESQPVHNVVIPTMRFALWAVPPNRHDSYPSICRDTSTDGPSMRSGRAGHRGYSLLSRERGIGEYSRMTRTNGTAPPDQPQRVFISYAHEGQTRRNRVPSLSSRFSAAAKSLVLRPFWPSIFGTGRAYRAPVICVALYPRRTTRAPFIRSM